MSPPVLAAGAPDLDDVRLESGSAVVSWSPPPPQYIVIQKGCTATNLAMTPIAEELTEHNGLIRVEHEGGTNALAFSHWINGTSDIAQTSTSFNAAERAEAAAKGMEVVDIAVGAEAVVVIVSPDVEMSSLTMTDLRGIYNGSITRWSELGGDDVPVDRVGALWRTNAYNLISSMVLLGDPYANMSQFEDRDIPGEVRNRTGAIGFLLSGLMPADAADMTIGIARSEGSGVAFDAERAFSSAYPLARTFHLITNGAPQGANATWVDFVLDPDQGQRILAENGFIPLADDVREEGREKIGSPLGSSVTYRVYRTHDGTEDVFTANGTQFVDSSPPAGTNVTYEVSAVIDGVESERSRPLVKYVPATAAGDLPSFIGTDGWITVAIPIAVLGGAAAVLLWRRKRR